MEQSKAEQTEKIDVHTYRQHVSNRNPKGTVLVLMSMVLIVTLIVDHDVAYRSLMLLDDQAVNYFAVFGIDWHCTFGLPNYDDAAHSTGTHQNKTAQHSTAENASDIGQLGIFRAQPRTRRRKEYRVQAKLLAKWLHQYLDTHQQSVSLSNKT